MIISYEIIIIVLFTNKNHYLIKDKKVIPIVKKMYK